MKEKGFSTIEMLIAIAVLAICFSAIILISFGSQSSLVDSQNNSEAINMAQTILEEQQALARKDFRLVNPKSITSDSANFYQTKIDVQTQPDFFTKKITTTVSWPDQYNRGLNVELSALVTNFENAIGGKTCDSVLVGDGWKNPSPPDSQIFSDTGAGSFVSLDAYKQKLYIAISNASTVGSSTIFVYGLTDPKHPNLVSQIDNASGIQLGINDIHATDKYLYVAKATGPDSGQLQIFDIFSGPIPAIKSEFKVGGVTGTGSQAIGKSIFYKDGYVYIGLTATDSGPEFHIIDVHNPTNPFEVGSWPQSGKLGSDINDIYVKGRYVYLATSDSEELIVLNISNPITPVKVGSFNVPGSGHGKILDLIGDNIYLGKTTASGYPEFYILNISDPTNILTIGNVPEISDNVNGILIRDYLAFLMTDNQFQIWRIDDSLSITSYATPLNFPSAGTGASFDCEGNYFYVGSVDSSNQGYLSVISTP